jgi:LysM repeat protein
VRTQFLFILLLIAALLTACTRDPATPEPTTTPAETVAPTRTSSEPVVETVGTLATTPTAAATATGTPEPGVSGALIQYTVQGGDTIGSIAAQFNVTEQQLRELNNLPNDDIFAGQILRVPEGEPTPTPEPFKHVVRAGETLTMIAAQYGVNFLTLVEVNGLESPDTLAEGTELLIPGVVASTSDADAAAEGGATSIQGASGGVAGQSIVTHVVQPGETLSTIAADYAIDTADLAAANNLTNPNMLRAGQQLIVPGVTQQQAVEARGVRHTVASGESLSQIAQNYGVTVEQIMAANGLDNPNTIVVGQELVIPQE